MRDVLRSQALEFRLRFGKPSFQEEGRELVPRRVRGTAPVLTELLGGVVHVGFVEPVDAALVDGGIELPPLHAPDRSDAAAETASDLSPGEHEGIVARAMLLVTLSACPGRLFVRARWMNVGERWYFVCMKPRWPVLVVPAGVSDPGGDIPEEPEQDRSRRRKPERGRRPGTTTVPDLKNTMRLLQTALVEMAAGELPDGVRRPSLDDDPYNAAWTYKMARGAPDVAGRTLEPGESGDFEMARQLQPPPREDQGAVIASVLHDLACHELLELACPPYHAELAAWKEVARALEAAAEASARAQAAPMLRPAEVINAERAARECQAPLRRAIAVLEQITLPEDYWAQSPEDRAREAFHEARLCLMDAFGDGKVARLTDDGGGGDQEARRERVRKARAAARRSAELERVHIPRRQALFTLLVDEP